MLPTYENMQLNWGLHNLHKETWHAFRMKYQMDVNYTDFSKAFVIVNLNRWFSSYIWSALPWIYYYLVGYL